MNGLGLAYWYDQLFGRAGSPDEALARMMERPAFDQACLASARGNLALMASSRAVRRAFRDSGRAFYAMFVMALDAKGPVTLASLQSLADEFGIASRGRVAAMMMYMRLSGYLERSAEQTNRRSIHFNASPKLVAAHDAFIRSELEAVALVEPEAQAAISHLTEPDFRRAYVHQMGLALMRLLQAPPEPTTLFAGRDAGLSILYQLAASGDGAYPARGPIALSLSDVARRHGVSRAHVTRLLRDAVKASLLQQGREGTWTIEETLRNGLRRQHALSFIGHAAFAHAALKAARSHRQAANEHASPDPTSP
jgi:AraC-like DNA-binding protein